MLLFDSQTIMSGKATQWLLEEIPSLLEIWAEENVVIFDGKKYI